MDKMTAQAQLDNALPSFARYQARVDSGDFHRNRKHFNALHLDYGNDRKQGPK